MIAQTFLPKFIIILYTIIFLYNVLYFFLVERMYFRNKQLRAHLVSEANDNISSDFEITTDPELGRLKQDILHGESLDSILNSIEQYDATVTRVERPVVVALVNKLRTVAACRSRTREPTIDRSLVTPKTSNVIPCHAEPSALNPSAEPKRSPKKLCRANSILLRSPAMCGVVADRKKMFERR
uniref:Uncharacterized protein n=1 Tax=Schizaphis graminum TaxID=13262 RepID=A0A2S2P8I4_SCHGA